MVHMVPPVCTQLVEDAALIGRDIRVWRSTLAYLDWLELRPLKLAVLEHDLGLSRVTIARALARLVARGYLVDGGRAYAGGPCIYRVPLSRAWRGGDGQPGEARIAM